MVNNIIKDIAYMFAQANKDAGNVDARISWSEDSEYSWTITVLGEDGISYLVFGPELEDE